MMTTFNNASGLATFLTLAALFGSATVAEAVIQLGTVQVTSIGHTFTPGTPTGEPRVKDFLIDQRQTSGGGGFISPVSANLDLDNQFRLTIAAPPGEKFLIRVPAGAWAQFEGQLVWNIRGAVGGVLGSVSASFGNLEGIAPSFANAEAVVNLNHLDFGFAFLGSSPISNDIAFTSITLIGTGLTQNAGLGTRDYSPSDVGQNIFYVIYPAFGAQTDPGRFVFIVPEPGAPVLLALGLILLAIFLTRANHRTEPEPRLWLRRRPWPGWSHNTPEPEAVGWNSWARFIKLGPCQWVIGPNSRELRTPGTGP